MLDTTCSMYSWTSISRISRRCRGDFKNIKNDFFLTNFLPQYPKYSGPNVTNFLQVDATCSIQPQGRVFTSNLCTFLRIWSEDWVEGFENFDDGGVVYRKVFLGPIGFQWTRFDLLLCVSVSWTNLCSSELWMLSRVMLHTLHASCKFWSTMHFCKFLHIYLYVVMNAAFSQYYCKIIILQALVSNGVLESITLEI